VTHFGLCVCLCVCVCVCVVRPNWLQIGRDDTIECPSKDAKDIPRLLEGKDVGSGGGGD